MRWIDYKAKLRKTALSDEELANWPVQKSITTYEPDEWGGHDETHHPMESVEEAISHLSDYGHTQPSAAPGFQPNMWYSHPDLGGDRSSHLNGFTEDEERQIWAGLTAQDQRHNIPDSPPPGQPEDWS